MAGVVAALAACVTSGVTLFNVYRGPSVAVAQPPAPQVVTGPAPPGPNQYNWSVGDVVDVQLPLVKSDRIELGCSSLDEVAGKHCAFEAPDKAWSKGENNDDKKLLKPYTTTDRAQFTAAGLWSEPALALEPLPRARFTVKCRYKVEGMLKTAAVRWERTGQWYRANNWYAGTLSDCKVVPPGPAQPAAVTPDAPKPPPPPVVEPKVPSRDPQLSLPPKKKPADDPYG